MRVFVALLMLAFFAVLSPSAKAKQSAQHESLTRHSDESRNPAKSNLLCRGRDTLDPVLQRDDTVCGLVETSTINTVPVWLARDATLPIATVRLIFTRAGFAYDAPDKQGLAELASNAMQEGAGMRDALGFKRELDDSAIKLSTEVDADNIYITLTYLKEHEAQAFVLLSDMLTKPMLGEEDIARLKSQTIALQKRMHEQPEYLASRAWLVRYFGAHPYAQEKSGTPETLAKLERRDIAQFLSTQLTAQNLLVIAVGDVEIQGLQTRIKPLVDGLSEHFTPQKKMEKISAPVKAGEELVAFNAPQSVVQFGGAGPLRTDTDFMAAFVVNHLLGGATLTSRLGEEIRKKSGLTYGITTQISPMQYASLWGGDVATRADKIGETNQKITQVIEGVRTQGITAKELADAKAYLTGSFALSLDTNAELAGFMTTMALHNLGADYLERRNAMIQAVTLEQANAVAQKYLRVQEWPRVTVGPTQ